MGLLLTLLTLPVSGPIKATTWVAQQVLEAAERDYYDEDSVRAALEDLDARHSLGAVTDEEYEAAADMLFERLVAARAYHALHRRDTDG